MNKINSIIDTEARLQTKMIMQTQNKCIPPAISVKIETWRLY